MTIVEFLLARIAEDEDVAREFDDVKPRYYEVSGMEPSPEYVTVYVSPARVLAECAAKRAIVERHSECGTGFGYCDDGGHGWGMGDEPLGCGNLGDLAAVYADHPDYDTAWA